MLSTRVLGAAVLACAAVSVAPPAAAQDDALLGEIRFFAGTFAPHGWEFCNGQVLPIRQNTALFSILGTTYGGDGSTTFALPDMRGRSPVQAGQGPGLSPVALGERGGAETRVLDVASLPAHNHQVGAHAVVPVAKGQGPKIATVPATDLLSPPGNTTVAGQSQPQPVPLRNPYVGLQCIIAVRGLFPARD